MAHSAWDDSTNSAGGASSSSSSSAMDAIYAWITNAEQNTCTAWMSQVLGRFGLLRGGFGASQAVHEVLDDVLAQYTKQVVQSQLQPFLDAMASSSSSSSSFEDAHVTTALNILKVAGWMHHEYESAWQERTQKEFRILQGRLEKHLKWLESTNSENKAIAAKFVLPDSLSTVEINSTMTLAVCGSNNTSKKPNHDSPAQKLEAVQSAVTALERFSKEKVLFPKAQKAVHDLARMCHVFCFDVCFAVPRLHLASLSSLPVWNKAAASTSSDDAYGILPQAYITHVGEHMLSLVQALEPFASDRAALALVQPIMKNVRHVAVQPWREVLAASGMEDTTVRVTGDTDESKILERLMTGKDLLDLVVGSHGLEEDADDAAENDGAAGEEDEEDEETKAITNFCNAWLDAVGLAVTGRLLERILRIPALSSKGCEHLHADLNYLVNVLLALGVQGHPHPLLSHVAELVVLETDILRERCIQSHDTREPLENVLAAMEKRLAVMKGGR